MGDRGNIVVDGVFLYTHWGGDDLRKVLGRALERGKDRWTDPAYLARIIFCEMLKAGGDDDLDGLNGFGISLVQMDYNQPNLVVDTQTGTVAVVEVESKKVREQKTFEDWVAQE